MYYEFVWILFLRFLTLRKKLQSAHKAYILNNKLSKLKRHTSHFCCFILVSISRKQGEGGDHSEYVQQRTRGGGVMHYVYVRTCTIPFYDFESINISICCTVHRQKMYRYNIFLFKRCSSEIYISSYKRYLLAVNLVLCFELFLQTRIAITPSYLLQCIVKRPY